MAVEEARSKTISGADGAAHLDAIRRQKMRTPVPPNSHALVAELRDENGHAGMAELLRGPLEGGLAGDKHQFRLVADEDIDERQGETGGESGVVAAVPGHRAIVYVEDHAARRPDAPARGRDRWIRGTARRRGRCRS